MQFQSCIQNAGGLLALTYDIWSVLITDIFAQWMNNSVCYILFYMRRNVNAYAIQLLHFLEILCNRKISRRLALDLVH